jgi:hypothetical protein
MTRSDATSGYVATLLAMLFTFGFSSSSEGRNIVIGVVSAPIAANGIQRDAPTDMTILLDAPGHPDGLALDHQLFGHNIPAGGKMEITLLGGFVRNPNSLIIGGSTGTSNASLILSPGAPQNGIATASASVNPVAGGDYRIADEGQTLIIIPNAGAGSLGLTGTRAQTIGVKLIHIRPDPNPATRPKDAQGNFLFPFTNRGEGGGVRVRIFDAQGNVVEEGWGTVTFERGPRPHVFLTNVGRFSDTDPNPANTSANFQRIPVGTRFNTPLRFVLFDGTGNDSLAPHKGIANAGVVTEGTHPLLTRFPGGLLVQDLDGNQMLDPSTDRILGGFTLMGPTIAVDGLIGPLTISSEKQLLSLPLGTLVREAGSVVGSLQSTLPGGLTTGAGNGSLLLVEGSVGPIRGIYTFTLELFEEPDNPANSNIGSRATYTIFAE